MDVHAEVLLAAGYVTFLLLVALGVELYAWSTHRGFQRAKTVGFQYHPHLSAWQCSEGNFLWQDGFDSENQVARYRAKASVCNKCACKHACTDSDEGRELLYPLGKWTATEIGRFHHGFALALLVLAGFFLAIALVRHPHGKDVLVLGFCVVPVLGMIRRTLTKIREPRMQGLVEDTPSARVSSFSSANTSPKRG